MRGGVLIQPETGRFLGTPMPPLIVVCSPDSQHHPISYQSQLVRKLPVWLSYLPAESPKAVLRQHTNQVTV